MLAVDAPQLGMAGGPATAGQAMPTAVMDAILLAGGQGRRMGGLVKAFLPVGGQPVIDRSLAVLRPMFRCVHIVTRTRAGWDAYQERLLTDDRPESGPLVGLARGLAASEAEWCFLAAGYMPFLGPAVIAVMARATEEDVDAVALRTGRLFQPLHAFYRRSCLPLAEDALAHGRTSVQDILRAVRVHAIAPEDLRGLDAGLTAFRDIDTPEDYAQAQDIAAHRSIQGRT